LVKRGFDWQDPCKLYFRKFYGNVVNSISSKELAAGTGVYKRTKV